MLKEEEYIISKSSANSNYFVRFNGVLIAGFKSLEDAKVFVKIKKEQ